MDRLPIIQVIKMSRWASVNGSTLLAKHSWHSLYVEPISLAESPKVAACLDLAKFFQDGGPKDVRLSDTDQANISPQNVWVVYTSRKTYLSGDLQFGHGRPLALF